MKFNQKNLLLLQVVAFLVFGILIYSNTFQNTFHFDDDPSIAQNYALRDISNISAIWNFWPTRFIAYLSFALNYHLHKFSLFGWHLVNIIVHIFAGLCLWWLMQLSFATPLLKDTNLSRQKNLVSFFAALLFLAHPIQTQGVTYVVQRAVSLATLFYLASLCLYVKARLSEKRSAIYYSGSLIVAVLAMFTKEMSITLPFAILLYEFCFLSKEEGVNWKYLAPVLATLLIIPLVMFFTGSVNFGEFRKVSEGPPGISSLEYLITEFRVIMTYLRLLIVPLNQNLDYDYAISKTFFNLPVLLSFLAIAAIFGFALRMFKKYRLVSFGIFFFFLTLIPESSLIPIKDVIFEHRLYLPMAGFSIFLVGSFYYFFENKRQGLKIPLLSIMVIFCGLLTFSRNYIWKDEFSLWNDTIRKSPYKARPYHNRALAYQNIKGYAAAIEDYNMAIKLKPDFAEAYINRGVSYRNLKDYNQAIADFSEAIKLKANSSEAYNNRANIFAVEQKFDMAFADFNQALNLDPKFAEAYCNRGLAYMHTGDFDKAVADFNKAIELNPNEPVFYYPRAYTYLKMQKYDLAWLDVRKAQKLGYKFDEKFIEDLQKASGKTR